MDDASRREIDDALASLAEKLGSLGGRDAAKDGETLRGIANRIINVPTRQERAALLAEIMDITLEVDTFIRTERAMLARLEAIEADNDQSATMRSLRIVAVKAMAQAAMAAMKR